MTGNGRMPTGAVISALVGSGRSRSTAERLIRQAVKKGLVSRRDRGWLEIPSVIPSPLTGVTEVKQAERLADAFTKDRDAGEGSPESAEGDGLPF